MKRISLFLAILLLLFSIPLHAYADVAGPEIIIKYIVGDDTTEKQAELVTIGTYKKTKTNPEGNARLVSLPYGAVIKSISWRESQGFTIASDAAGKTRCDKSGPKNYGKPGTVFPVSDCENYLVNDEFVNLEEIKFKPFVADENKGYLKLNEGVKFPTTEVKGFVTCTWYQKTVDGKKINYHDITYIQISTYNNQTVDKTALKSQIDFVTGDNEKNWYKFDDRFNGKVSEYKSSGSYWADMQQKLISAQESYNDNNISQDTINTAALNLQHAIAKMIPASNINATELYEEINTAPKKIPLPYSNYTTESWQIYNSAKVHAQALLDSLYDSEGKPTEKNKSSDPALLTEIQTEISNLKAVRESMDPIILGDDTNDAKLKYETLNNLLKVYNKTGFDESLYTTESWNNFVSAYDGAKNYVNTHSAPGDVVGKRQYDEVNEQYGILWRGIHRLTDKKDKITVTIKVVDTLALRMGISPNDKCGIHTKTLSGDKTLNKAIDGLGDKILSALNAGGVGYMDSEYLYATSINGILTTNSLGRGIAPLGFKTQERNEDEKSLYDIQLHDGDVVTLAFLEQPVEPNSSGTGSQSIEERLFQNFYKQSAILQDGKNVEDVIEVDEGQELNLSAIYKLPHISTYSDKIYPLSGAAVFVSEAAESTKSIKASTINTDVLTDGSGNFNYTFYSPGYYALSIHDIRANALVGQDKGVEAKSAYGLTIGDTIYVHVNGISTEQLEAAKEKLVEDLDAVYGAYTESFFSAEDWAKIEEFRETGISLIGKAATLKDAKAAYDASLSGIKAIQDKTVGDNTSKLDGLRAILSRLPNDASLLGQSNAFLAEEMVKRYEAMSAYQKNQLTGLELNKYESLKAAYYKGLPELEPYKLNIEIAADSQLAKEAIEDMIGYVSEHGKNTDLLYNFKIAERNIAGTTISGKSLKLDLSTAEDLSSGVSISTPSAITANLNSSSTTQSAIKAYPDNYVSFASNLDIFTLSFNDELNGEGWKILNDSPEIVQNTNLGKTGYFALKGKTILIGGTEYEIKKIEATSVYDINAEQQSLIYDNKNTSFQNALRSFIMPYQDVVVTVTWGPVDGNANQKDSEELALAKTNAVNSLKESYEKYKSSEYTDDGWATLVNAKNAGLEQISSATSIEAVSNSLKNAITAMGAVEKKTITGEVPDFGKVLGTVDVYVENTTFSGGAFTGAILSESNFDYAEKDTMMTIVLRALAENGYGWTGTGGTKAQGIDDYEISYLASITKNGKSLGEFSGDAGSGWMGTLNDFFTNEGFQQFTVKNGKISDGDEIRIMFTQNLGKDLGGTWGNSHTTLSNLKLSAGKLYPSFSSSINEYTLVLSSSDSKLKITPTASNRNYLVKTFLNDKVTSNKEGVSFYKRTRNIPVRAGDFINIGVGEYAWPSMNNQETEARNYSGTWYKLNIITPDDGAAHVVSLIDKLPTTKVIKLNNEDIVKSIRAVYDVLSSSEKLKVTNIQKLTEAENRISLLQEIESVKALLKKIPDATKVTLSDKTVVMSADSAYKKLTDEQKLYITVGDVKNYNDAIDKLTELGAFNSGSKPSKIQGSTEVPVIEGKTVDMDAETKVVNKVASSKVTQQQVKDILAKIKDSDVTKIKVNAKSDMEISKSNIEMPKTSLAEISKAKLELYIETSIGNIEIPDKALEKISEQADGSNVEITFDKIDKQKLTKEQLLSAGEETVYDISITSSGKKITSFGDQEITISLPYKLKEGQNKDKVSVWYLNDKGELEKVKCSYDVDTGLASFASNHLSYYIVGYDNSICFIDVNEDDWFYQSVMYVVQKSLFAGTSETNFSPNAPMTRAMIVTVLYRLDDMPESTSANKFADIEDSDWYFKAVKWSAEKELVKGITENEFKPDVNVTREQLAAMLYRYAEMKQLNTKTKGDLNRFTDNHEMSSWAEEALKWAVGNGLITGKENNTLDPRGNASRAEVAEMLKRFVENIK